MSGRKRKCPECGGKVVRIVYGMPGPGLMQDADDGKVLLGGCCIGFNDPDRGCVDCEWVDHPPLTKEEQEFERLLAEAGIKPDRRPD